MRNYLSSNRSFGVLLAFICIFISIIFYGLKITFLIWISLFIIILSLTKPDLFKYPKDLWIKFGILLGKIINPIICAFLYFFVIGLTKICLDIFQKKLIFKNKQKNRVSYWIIRNDKFYRNFDNQF